MRGWFSVSALAVCVFLLLAAEMTSCSLCVLVAEIDELQVLLDGRQGASRREA
jgi:hypothetical protein